MGAPMSMAEDLVKRLREAHTNSTQRILGSDIFEAAADLIEQQAASLAAKDEEIERLRAVDPRTSLLTVIADIREKTGVGGKPMLDELAGAIAEKLTSKDRALAEAVEVLRPFVRNEVDGALMMTRSHVQEAVAAARAFVAQHGSDSREGK